MLLVTIYYPFSFQEDTRVRFRHDIVFLLVFEAAPCNLWFQKCITTLSLLIEASMCKLSITVRELRTFVLGSVVRILHFLFYNFERINFKRL